MISLLALTVLAGELEPHIGQSNIQVLDSLWRGTDSAPVLRGSIDIRQHSKKLIEQQMSDTAGGPAMSLQMLAYADLHYEEGLACLQGTKFQCESSFSHAYEVYLRMLSSAPDSPNAGYSLEMAFRCLWHAGDRGRDKIDELSNALPNIARSPATLLIEGEIAERSDHEISAVAAYQRAATLGSGHLRLLAEYRLAWLAVRRGDSSEGITLLENVGSALHTTPAQYFVGDAAREDLLELYKSYDACPRGKLYFHHWVRFHDRVCAAQ